MRRGSTNGRFTRWWIGVAAAASLSIAAGLILFDIAPSGQETPETVRVPHFVEETAAAGIDHIYDGDWMFFVGGGVAVFDCNGDGRPDIFLPGGKKASALYRNESSVGGELRFVALAEPASALTEVTGAYPIDIDADDLIDLAVLRFGENVLLRGLGNCRFERANETWGFDGGNAWTAAFSATWEESASLPTLAFGNYVGLSDTGERTESCSPNQLVRPAGESTRYEAATSLNPSWCTLSILFSDWGRSGRSDLRVANDRHYYRDGEEQLWRIEAGEAPQLHTRDEGWEKVQIWGMGIASHDVTGDGLPEVFLTSQGDNKLQTLADGPAQARYRDIALGRGVTAHRPFTGDPVLPSTAWHAEFQDVNNDSFIDLFIAKGNVEAMPEFAANDPSNLLLGNPDGIFSDSAEAAGITNFARSRGAALADFNLDGMLDLVEVNRRENVKLWRNLGSGEVGQPAPIGNWIGLQLQQPGANRDAVGSWIAIKVDDRIITEREVTIGGGHAGGQLGWVHFGLGESETAEIRVQWPDGEVGPWLSASANQFAIVERGRTGVRPWVPLRQ